MNTFRPYEKLVCVFCSALRLHPLDLRLTIKGGLTQATRAEMTQALGAAQLDAALTFLGQLDDAHLAVDALMLNDAFAATTESLARRV